jgi:hypothetical protein
VEEFWPNFPPAKLDFISSQNDWNATFAGFLRSVSTAGFHGREDHLQAVFFADIMPV